MPERCENPRNKTNFSTGQILTFSTQPIQISYVSTHRTSTKLTNLSDVEVWYGNSNAVAPGTGDLLPAGRGQWVSIPANSIIFVCTAGGTATIAWAEAFDLPTFAASSPPFNGDITGDVNATIVSPLDASGNVKVAIENTPTVDVGNFPATQPVSGTVTANQGTANTLAHAWPEEITDGTNGPVAVKPASTAPVATDPSLVVAISPNSPAQVESVSNLPNQTGSGGSGGGDCTRKTYSSAVSFTPGTGAGPIITFNRPFGTNVARITKFGISCNKSAVGQVNFWLQKYTAHATGGVAATPIAATPHDSNNPVASWLVTGWTTTPTPAGSLVGQFRNFLITATTSTGSLEDSVVELKFGENESIQPIVLRGTEELQVIASGTITGLDVSFWFEWSEE